jgi:N-acetylglutamate synthase-like GNAT family acetyltransferase
MEIRAARTADASAIMALIRSFPDQLMQDHLPDPDAFFVAEEFDPSTGSGQVIGCCALEIYSKRLAEVRSLAVAQKHQGKGIASALVDACVGRAKERGVYEVLSITGTPAFFEKHGFGTFHQEKYALIKILG